MPRVAVIIPCFDDGATLADAVGSVMRQSEDVELVVVDDGSTDPATLGALAELERDGVRVLRQANEGPSAAAMAGVRATDAPLVMRFDADDVLEPGAVTALADVLERASADVAAAWGDMRTFGVTSFRVPSAPALDPWLVTYANCIHGAGSLFRRAALLDAGGWQLRAGYEDWDVWMALAERGYRGAYVARVIFGYRRDEGGRFAGALERFAEHAGELAQRHPELFARRADNRRTSATPTRLRLAVTVVDNTPFLAPLTKSQLCEALTHLLWNGGLRATVPMLYQGASLRLRRRRAVTTPVA